MVNPWVIVYALIVVAGVGAGGYLYGNHVGAQGVKLAWDQDKLAQAKTLSDAKDQAAADLKTAQDAANAAVVGVLKSKEVADANYNDALKRIAALRVRLNQVPARPVPETGDHPAVITGPSTPTELLARALTEFAGCGREYRSVASAVKALPPQ